MSDPVSLPTAKPTKINFGEVMFRGKVIRVTRYENLFYTQMICPAPDHYSKPQIVEIRSKSGFADLDQEVDVKAKLGGYHGKTYKSTNKDTGVVKTVYPVNLTLDLVE